MSDIEEFGDDAIWVPMTPEEIVESRKAAKESGAEFDRIFARMEAEGKLKPRTLRIFTQEELDAVEDPPY